MRSPYIPALGILCGQICPTTHFLENQLLPKEPADVNTLRDPAHLFNGLTRLSQDTHGGNSVNFAETMVNFGPISASTFRRFVP